MYCPGMVRVSRDLGILDLTGGCSVHAPIHVLSRDGQSILGSRDTLTGECSVLVPIHVLSWDGQSISGSRDSLSGGGAGGTVCIHPFMYCSGMIRVSWNLGIL